MEARRIGDYAKSIGLKLKDVYKFLVEKQILSKTEGKYRIINQEYRDDEALVYKDHENKKVGEPHDDMKTVYITPNGETLITVLMKTNAVLKEPEPKITGYKHTGFKAGQLPLTTTCEVNEDTFDVKPFEKNDGGQAYPYENVGKFKGPGGEYHNNPPLPGMTMRQWYKGMALQGLLSIPMKAKSVDVLEEKVSMIITNAGHIADAMIKEDEDFEKDN